MRLKTQTFSGPSLWAPFAAVALELLDPPPAPVAVAQIQARWNSLDPSPLPFPESAPQTLLFVELVAALAVHLQHPDDYGAGRCQIRPQDAETGALVLLATLDPQASLLVFRASVELAGVLTSEAPIPPQELPRRKAELAQLRSYLHRRLPQSPIVRTLIREALRRSIPVSAVAIQSRVWLFGHGSQGAHYREAATDRDSLTGFALARDKAWTKDFLNRLGFPIPRGDVVSNASAAVALAAHLGYPVVIKPVGSGKGCGVSAGILDEAGLRVAFAEAEAFSQNSGVIVEQHIDGIDHRLAVFGGRFTWAVARHPPTLVGDGRHTLRELLDQDNRRRAEQARDELVMVLPLKVDAEVEQTLQQQGLSMEDRPSAGRRITLRSIANLSQGGISEDVTSAVHPDNRELAEAVARAFRLDAAGIDLMTPAIDRSWREQPCAILEVNSMPGIYSYDSSAAKILEARFPPPGCGRIPSVLLIGSLVTLRQQLVKSLSSTGHLVGWSDEGETRLGEAPRFAAAAPLAARVDSLLADPHCDALVVQSSVETLIRNGLPLDRFDLAISEAALPSQLGSLVRSCSGDLLDGWEQEDSQERLVNWLRALPSHQRRDSGPAEDLQASGTWLAP